MRIGLLSDTHGFLDPKIFEHLSACDEVWHAGDIGDISVAHALEGFKPFKAVFGNIDDLPVRARYPEDLWITVEGLTVLITHIGGVPPTYNKRVKNLFRQQRPDVFICGHSHILRIKRDPSWNDMLYLNPGAAGNHGFHQIKTIVRFDIANAVISNMEVIEMGKRGVIPG
ncbi:MAG TPA: metallophosphoesterase family protein [Chryseosolibacter sp.]|nr:metallophosphoesterase family protein [Chryseosolibacter sp.]